MPTLTRLLILICAVSLATAQAGAQDDNLWQLQTSDLHAPYSPAAMASGVIGIVPARTPLHIGQVVLNHVFDAPAPGAVSRVMRGVNPFGLTMRVDGEDVGTAGIAGWQQTVDMRRAAHVTSFTSAGKAGITAEVRALRCLPYAGMVTVRVKALEDASIEVQGRTQVPDDYGAAASSFRTIDADGTAVRLVLTDATAAHGGCSVGSAMTFLFESGDAPAVDYDSQSGGLCFSIRLAKGETFAFTLFGSICPSTDFNDPCNEAERQAVYAVHEGRTRLVARHEALWEKLWRSDITIEGDDDAQRLVRFALFNLYSSCREGSRLSIPPMGLTSQGYGGHVFWDAEVWIYPPLLLLQTEMARAMLDYRTDRLPQARRKAVAYGYRGAMFPWESDASGDEATPTFALTGPFEHHVTADVGLAFWDYYRVTRDTAWLCREGWPVMSDVADFWVSRASRNGDGTYSIAGVTGADEYANNVTDDAFTNATAALALGHACSAAAVCGRPAPHEWGETARGLRILQSGDGVTLEHSTYRGETIKQADANLLAYPLGVTADTGQQRRDLEYYAGRIDQRDGPMMSYAVFCVQYARMGDAAKAYEMFERCYRPHWRPPFGALAETAASDNPYFVTGAGGLLQAVLNGFCGLQVTDEGIVQVPSVLPLHWRKVTVTGVGTDKKTFERKQ